MKNFTLVAAIGENRELGQISYQMKYLNMIKELLFYCYFPEFEISDWKITPLIEGKDEDTIYKIREYRRKKV